MSAPTSADLETARSFAKDGQLADAESAYRTLLQKPAGTDEKAVQIQELALYELGKLYCDHK